MTKFLSWIGATNLAAPTTTQITRLGCGRRRRTCDRNKVGQEAYFSNLRAYQIAITLTREQVPHSRCPKGNTENCCWQILRLRLDAVRNFSTKLGGCNCISKDENVVEITTSLVVSG